MACFPQLTNLSQSPARKSLPWPVDLGAQKRRAHWKHIAQTMSWTSPNPQSSDPTPPTSKHQWMKCTVCRSEVSKTQTRDDKVWRPTKIVPGFHHCSSFVHRLLPWIKIDPVLHALPSAVAPHHGTGWKARPWRSDDYCFPPRYIKMRRNQQVASGLIFKNLRCSGIFWRFESFSGLMA